MASLARNICGGPEQRELRYAPEPLARCPRPRVAGRELEAPSGPFRAIRRRSSAARRAYTRVSAHARMGAHQLRARSLLGGPRPSEQSRS
jgi:hypothetical protein